MKVGFGDFNVVAKDLIEADFERSDAGAFALALFHGGDDLLAVLGEVSELVEFGVKAGADHTGVGGKGRWFVGNGTFELVTDVGEFINFAVEMAKQFAAA